MNIKELLNKVIFLNIKSSIHYTRISLSHEAHLRQYNMSKECKHLMKS